MVGPGSLEDSRHGHCSASSRQRRGTMRSPVLLIAFNRPDFAAQSVRSIVHQTPPVLYVACDGPRNSAEAATVEHTRETVLSEAADRVEVRTLFRAENLGCKRGVDGA